MKKPIYNVVIVDDHSLFAKSLKVLIDSFDNFRVSFTADNGMSLETMLSQTRSHPDLILLDMQMPERNGIDTMKWLSKTLPDIKVLALSMDDDEDSVIKMIHAGAMGYILKDADPDDLHKGMTHVCEHGQFHTDLVSTALMNALKGNSKSDIKINDREREFLNLACSQLTYKEIASEMYLSPKTIDGYRDHLFKQFEVKNRVGLVIFALAHKLIQIEGITK